MPVRRYAASLSEKHKSPFWGLLRTRDAPVGMALLQANFLEESDPVPASRLFERLARDIERLRPYHDIAETPQRLVAEWAKDGYLTRRRPQDHEEDVYELTPDVAALLRFLSGPENRPRGLTESRLHTVLRQIRLLADETDPASNARMKSLLAERQRIDDELRRLEAGIYEPLDRRRAAERLREIHALTERLPDDFLYLRGDLERLHRDLREQIVAPGNEARGDVLARVFAGADVIADSDAGRSFTAFWRLLTDPSENAALDAALEALAQRDFAREGAPEILSFLERFTGDLLERADRVHDTMNGFAHSLRQFVQSRMYKEQAQIQAALREARQAALVAKEAVKPDHKLAPLPLTGIRRCAFGQWKLRDPAETAAVLDIRRAEDGAPDPAAFARLLDLSDIHWDALERAVDRTLALGKLAVSVGTVLEAFPARQGLASVVGLVAIACRREALHHAGHTEEVFWDDDGTRRGAIVPMLFFQPSASRPKAASHA